MLPVALVALRQAVAKIPPNAMTAQISDSKLLSKIVDVEARGQDLVNCGSFCQARIPCIIRTEN